MSPVSLHQVFEKDQRRMEEVMDLKSHWQTTPELTSERHP